MCSSSNRTCPAGKPARARRIENYLGFPTGISGLDLTGRAYAQAQKFGAEVMVAKGATKLACAHPLYAVHLEDGGRIDARALIIASGAQYRKPAIANVSQFEGAGVYYAASRMESQLCVGEEVVIVGGGNSAGQAAVFLAQTAKHVHLLVRKDGLADTMSRYLVRRIEEHPAITLRTQTELVALDGEQHLDRVQWRDGRTSAVETHDIRHVFMMTGAVPNTGWLDGCVALDGAGFIKTGPDLSPDDLTAADGRWRGRRICWKRIAPASSRSATCAAATSSASHPRSAKDRLPSPLFIRCFASSEGMSRASGIQSRTEHGSMSAEIKSSIDRVTGNDR